MIDGELARVKAKRGEIATLIKTDVCLRDIRTFPHPSRATRKGRLSVGRLTRIKRRCTSLYGNYGLWLMAYHRQGRARPASVLEFLDTHLEAERKENSVSIRRWLTPRATKIDVCTESRREILDNYSKRPKVRAKSAREIIAERASVFMFCMTTRCQ